MTAENSIRISLVCVKYDQITRNEFKIRYNLVCAAICTVVLYVKYGKLAHSVVKVVTACSTFRDVTVLTKQGKDSEIKLKCIYSWVYGLKVSNAFILQKTHQVFFHYIKGPRTHDQ